MPTFYKGVQLFFIHKKYKWNRNPKAPYLFELVKANYGYKYSDHLAAILFFKVIEEGFKIILRPMLLHPT